MSPREFGHADDLGGGRPRCLVECCHEPDGRVLIDAEQIAGVRDGRGVISADMRLRDLEEVIEDAWLAAFRRRGATRAMTAGVLADAARIDAESANCGAPVQAVADQMGAASSIASRYVKLARWVLAPRETR